MIIEGVPGSSARDQSRAKTDVLKEMKHYGQHRHFHWIGFCPDVRRRYKKRLPLWRNR